MTAHATGHHVVGVPLRGADPRRLGEWELIRRLGAGGMGVVYLARREGHYAAVKVISGELAADAAFRSRFEREVRLCERVASPYVAEVIDADPTGEVPWLAMEYVAGPTLLQRVNSDGPLSPRALQQLAIGTAGALASIHAVGVVHRDLKPSNVILTADGPVVIDFGVAAAADATTLTSTGTSLGSPGWMAPEQIRGEPVTAAADIFAWGALVAFAATARPPYGTGRAEAVAYRVVHEAPDLAGMHGQIASLAHAALTADRTQRPSSSDLIAGLTAGTDGPEPATAVVAATAAQAAPTVVAATPQAQRVDSRRVRRVFVGSAFTLVVLVGAVAAFLVGQSMRGVPDQPASESSTTTPSAAEEASDNTVESAAPPRETLATAEHEMAPIPTSSNDFEPIVITVPHGTDPPGIPDELDGWRPSDAMQSETIRVFEYEEYSLSYEIGLSTNSCSDQLWTARWRMTNDGIDVKAAVEFRALVEEPGATPEQLANAGVSGAGYMAGFGCETPVFAWSGSSSGSGNLGDLVIEWQEWVPAV